MVFEFYKFDKDNWKQLAGSYVQNDEYLSLVLQGCSAEQWTEVTGLGSKSLQRYRANLGLTRKYGVRRYGEERYGVQK